MILASCSESNFEDSTPQSSGEEYVVLEEGRFKEYRYDTIAFRGIARDTFSGYLKKVVQDWFINSTGDTTYRVNVYWKREQGDAYQLNRVETERIEDGKYIVSENGLNFIKLVFPIKEKLSWAGNSLFDTDRDVFEDIYGESVETFEKDKKWKYRINSLGDPLEVGSLIFDKNIDVSLINDSTLNSYRKVNEFYAEKVGLVQKKSIILTSTNIVNTSIYDEADSGYILHLEVINFN